MDRPQAPTLPIEIVSDSATAIPSNTSSEIQTEKVRCNLCGSDDAELLFWGEDRLLKHPGRFPIVRCCKCGLVYQSPRPVDISPFYEGDYPPFDHDEDGAWRPLFHRLRVRKRPPVYGPAGLYFDVLRQVAPTMTGRLLDVGCGAGDFIAAMSRIGFEVYGVEVSPRAAEVANARLKALGRQPVLNIELGRAREADYPDDFFDVITLWHVIEHLPDPLTTLMEVRRIMKPDGLCLIQTPKLGSPESHAFGKYWAGWDSPRHLWIFSEHTLTLMAKRAGLKVMASLNGVSSGIAKLSLKFWANDVIKPGFGDWIYQQFENPLLDRLVYYLLMPVDQLGLGSQLTLCFNKP